MGISTESGASALQVTSASSQIIDTAFFQSVNTTTTTTITPGSHTFTVASATNIAQYMVLTIGTGSTMENVIVATISGTSVTATFVNSHSGTTTVVANVQRQIVTPGSASVQGNTAEYDIFGNAFTSIRNGLYQALVTAAGMLGVIPVDGSGYQFASPTTSGVPLCVTAGGTFTFPVAAGAGTNTVYGYPCILTGIVITAAGTTGNNTLWDNASAGSGTKIALACGTTSNSTMLLGTYVPLQVPCANGITAVGATSSPGFTVCYMPINNVTP